MVDLAQRQQSPGLHIVIASNRELLAWKSELEANDQTQVYPYWGEKADRQQVFAVLRAEYFSRQTPAPHVLITSYDIFVEDLRMLGIIQWQLALVEVPFTVLYHEQMNSVWMQLLCLRARHRLLISHTEFHVDTRRVLQFLLPELFSSRRKLLVRSIVFNESNAAFNVETHTVDDLTAGVELCSVRRPPDSSNGRHDRSFHGLLRPKRRPGVSRISQSALDYQERPRADDTEPLEQERRAQTDGV